jgi:hypothetical protein
MQRIQVKARFFDLTVCLPGNLLSGRNDPLRHQRAFPEKEGFFNKSQQVRLLRGLNTAI